MRPEKSPIKVLEDSTVGKALHPLATAKMLFPRALSLTSSRKKASLQLLYYIVLNIPLYGLANTRHPPTPTLHSPSTIINGLTSTPLIVTN